MKPIVSLAAASLCAALALPASAAGVPHLGAPAPPFRLTTTSGRTLDSTSLRGKPVYVNLFASWCGPCNVEAPGIAELASRYRSRGLVVVGMDESESRERAAGFASKYKLPYAIALDSDGKVGDDYGVQLGLPIHVFIDRRGRVKLYRAGEMSQPEIDAAIASIVKR